MPRLRPKVLLALLLALVSLPVAALDLVYVVRHAQKNPSDRWSVYGALRPLSHKGARCAGLLGQTLRHRGIAAVYASESTRTLATGLAVSGASDEVGIVGDDATLHPSPVLVEKLLEKHAEDRAILIVGHSNTVDDLVLAFRPDMKACLATYRLERPGIDEKQYGDIWRLSVHPDMMECRGVNRQVLPKSETLDCTTP